MLEVASQAPDFTVPDHDGNDVALTEQRGRWTLLWWYPKASTPG